VQSLFCVTMWSVALPNPFFQPLVSHENLFYESVEREAPPLLSFIPRYLGVMLVTYRCVPKAALPLSHNTTSATTSPHKSSSMDMPTISRPPFQQGVATHSSLAEEYEDEAEMPEVVLDRNRHIVPSWLLCGGARGRHVRSFSHSHLHPMRAHARRPLLDGDMASSLDLDMPVAVLHLPRFVQGAPGVSQHWRLGTAIAPAGDTTTPGTSADTRLASPYVFGDAPPQANDLTTIQRLLRSPSPERDDGGAPSSNFFLLFFRAHQERCQGRSTLEAAVSTTPPYRHGP
jgi:hypothetical protein